MSDGKQRETIFSLRAARSNWDRLNAFQKGGVVVGATIALAAMWWAGGFAFDMGALIGAGIAIIAAVEIVRFEDREDDRKAAVVAGEEAQRSSIFLQHTASRLLGNVRRLEPAIAISAAARTLREVAAHYWDVHEVQFWADNDAKIGSRELRDMIEMRVHFFEARALAALPLALSIEVQLLGERSEMGIRRLVGHFDDAGRIGSSSYRAVLEMRNEQKMVAGWLVEIIQAFDRFQKTNLEAVATGVVLNHGEIYARLDKAIDEAPDISDNTAVFNLLSPLVDAFIKERKAIWSE
jgi:hypothetical protein